MLVTKNLLGVYTMGEANIWQPRSEIKAVGAVLNYPNLATAVASTKADLGDAVNLVERTTGFGGGAMWDYVLATSVTTNTYNIVACTGDTSLALVLRVNGKANILQFGAIPDGNMSAGVGTNNFGAIAACLATGLPTFIPTGVFKFTGNLTATNVIYGMGITNSVLFWGDTGTLPSGYSITFSNLKGGVVSGFHYSGQASTSINTVNLDPTSWTAGNHDTWYGSQGLRFLACSDVEVRNVKSSNSAALATIRLQGCTNMLLKKCIGARARGNFGDALYQVDCDRTTYIKCRMYDYTRIGFVSEGNFGAGTLSHDVTYESCYTEYGHDGSNLHGGTEFNSGFWAENTDGAKYSQCTSVNNVDRGFIYAPTGALDVLQTVSAVTYLSCTARDTRVGFLMHGDSLNIETKAAAISCSAFNVTRGFVATASNKIKAEFISCYAQCKGNDDNSYAFSGDASGTGVAIVSIIDCSTDWLDTSRLIDNNTNTGDVSQFESGGTKIITVRNLRNGSNTYSIIKNRQSPSYELLVENCSQPIWFRVVSQTDKVTLRNIEAYGDIRSTEILVDKLKGVPTKGITLYNGEITGSIILHESKLVLLYNAGNTETLRVTVNLECDVKRDIDTDGAAIQLLYSQAVIPTSIFSGSFYNSGVAVTGTATFIQSSIAGATVLADSIFKDDTVVNMFLDVSTPSNFATGQRNITVH